MPNRLSQHLPDLTDLRHVVSEDRAMAVQVTNQNLAFRCRGNQLL